MSTVDLGTAVGSVRLPNPVMTASGTAGHGAELAAYVDLSRLGAVVVKSLSAEPWGGNPPPRLHPTDGGMLNSVGLQNPGVERWLEQELPALLATGARVVASIWGTSPGAYEKAAALVDEAPPQVVAVEVNLSCPNLEGGRHVFAHSRSATAEAVAAAGACGRPRWAKLSADVADLTEIADGALSAGADALTLVNTLRALAIDPATRRYRLGAGGGGLSGPAIRPVAVRAVHECRKAFPSAAIVGVGGVAGGEHAVEMLLAGADAVQVGTATFADPRAPQRVLDELSRWCARHDVGRVSDLVGAARPYDEDGVIDGGP
ncbi:MAG TPA: dihydroorotate dehydrogenase [Acidimicrobiales bacterium]|nr:dihydroorotate dehydrogenase [Acidimicrobiales bacterium]